MDGLRRRRAVTALVGMGAVSGLSAWATPTRRLADQWGRLDLEALVPREVGPWVHDAAIPTLVVNPQTQATLDAIYLQVLNRIYRDRTGGLLMLSVAYGLDQRDDMALHYPEVCYPAQGFQLHGRRDDLVSTDLGQLPVRRLETVLGSRVEPITYWATVGANASLGGYRKKLLELRYAARGLIPDGLLFRLSSVDPDSPRAFAAHDGFIRQLVALVPQPALSRVTGLGQGWPE